LELGWLQIFYQLPISHLNLEGKKKVTMDKSQELHHRATLGERLSASEQAQLDAWYQALESAEIEEIFKREVPNTRTLQTEIMAALKQIRLIAKRMEQLTVENEQIRRENVALRHQLAPKISLQQAGSLCYQKTSFFCI
jgi:DNA-binding IclR family transcriptional regulator